MHTDMYIYTLVHSLMYVFTYCTYFFCVFNGWCLSLPLSVSLSLCVYIYTYLYTYIIYILCTFCQISNLRALHPEANLYRQIHGFPVDPLQSSRSQVHATGVAVSEGLAEKG